MTIHQLFCTVKDLTDDMETPGGDVARMLQAIRDASDYLQKEIGWFIPVTQTVYLNGNASPILFTPPLLAATAVVNDDDTLIANTDYLLRPSPPHWASGPYTWIEIGPDATQIGEWLDEENGVQITGRWGMYERSVALSATVADTTQQSASQSTLKVSSAAEIWPGMTLLIGSEQQLVTGYGDPTAAVTTLDGSVAGQDDVLTLAAVSGVNVSEILRVDFEKMLLRDKNTTTLKCFAWRGWDRTNRVAHLDDASVDVYRTFTVERGVNGTTAAVHATGAAISRYDPPDDIRFLTRQIATLMLSKAKGSYAGKSGNENTGTVYYNDAFPRFEIERVAANYYLP